MNSTPTIQLAPTELPSVTPIGNLLSNLDEATQARVLEEPFMRCPLVTATKLFPKILQEKLMKYGYFDINLGKFIRTKVTLGGAKIGPMGWINSEGYINIGVANFDWRQSHLVYLWFTGQLPEVNKEIDHISGDRSDDRPSNLRLVSKTINQRNAKKRIDNTSGYTGVSWHRASGKWASRYGMDIWIGLFDTAEEAYIARKAHIEAHPELGFTARHGT